MIWRALLVGLFAVLALGAEAERPSEFYVVSQFDSDLEGAWNYHILDVRADGPDSLVRNVLMTPVRLCPHSLTVRAAEARLPNTSPAQLTIDQNPCDGTLRSQGANTPRNVASRFSTYRTGIVAKCGLEEKSGTLPQLDALIRRIIDRAFGSREVFWGISEEEDLEPQRQGDKLVSEIASGSFDKGLKAAFREERTQRTFRDLLKDYSGVMEAREFVDRPLVTANGYRFIKYVEPDYPALGVAALLLGKVEFQLRVDTGTGEVQNVAVVRGQEELAERARKAARNWQFEPQSLDSELINVAVDFKFRCPAPAR